MDYPQSASAPSVYLRSMWTSVMWRTFLEGEPWGDRSGFVKVLAYERRELTSGGRTGSTTGGFVPGGRWGGLLVIYSSFILASIFMLFILPTFLDFLFCHNFLSLLPFSLKLPFSSLLGPPLQSMH